MTPGNAANIRDRAAPRRTVDSGLGARTAASHGGAAAAHLSCCPPRQREGACAAHRGRPRSPTRDSHFTILTARTRRSASATKWSPASARRKSLDCAKWWRRALSGKGFLLCELDRKDEALAVCYEFLRYRFGENNEPELRGMMEGILSAEKTSLASSRALPARMGFAQRITAHSTSGTSARHLVRERGPRSLLPAPSTRPEAAAASPRAVGPPAAARPRSPRRSPAIAASAAGRDPHRTH
jgi:hypothetical protein